MVNFLSLSFLTFTLKGLYLFLFACFEMLNVF